MDVTDRQRLERALAATYEEGERQLDDYRAVKTASATMGETMKDVAEKRGFSADKAYDLNQGQYAPNPVNAIQTAEDRG